MATILEIKQANQDNIRAKTAPGSILRHEDAAMRDVVANELRDRGVIQAASVAALATTSHENTKLVIVENGGLFIAFETDDAADNISTFESADEGWLWKKIAKGGSGKIPVKVDGEVGSPVDDTFTFQHDDLIGAIVEDIIVNKQLETIVDGDFALNAATGTITRVNKWFTGDTGIINYIK